MKVFLALSMTTLLFTTALAQQADEIIVGEHAGHAAFDCSLRGCSDDESVSVSAPSPLTRVVYGDVLSKASSGLASTTSVSHGTAYASTAVAVAGGVALTTFLIAHDQHTYDVLHGWKKEHATARTISPLVTELGNGVSSMAMFGGFMVYSVIANDRKALDVGKIGLESFAVSGITVQILKHLFSRERPSDATRPGGDFHGPFAYFRQSGSAKRGYAAFDAFPSGHTTTAFAAATTLADMYQAPWVSYASYSVATTIAVTRVMERTHWLSDCFVGAVLGYYSTKLVEKLNYGTTDISIHPFADEYNSGVILSLRVE